MLALYKTYVTKSGRIKVEKTKETVPQEHIDKLIESDPYYTVYSFSPTKGISLILSAVKEERKILKRKFNFLNHILKLRLLEEYIERKHPI